MSNLFDTKSAETLVDISYAAGRAGYYSGNSRADIQTFIWWAQQFENKYSEVDWEETNLDYIEEVDNYVGEKLKEYRKNIRQVNTTITLPEKFPFFTGVEVESVQNEGDGICTLQDPKDWHDAHFHSVYLRKKDGMAQCIADCETREQAEKLAGLITLATAQAKTKFYIPDGSKFDAVEIDAIKRDENGVEYTVDDDLPFPESEDFYSVFLHDINGGRECIADCPTEEDALRLQKLIYLINH